MQDQTRLTDKFKQQPDRFSGKRGTPVLRYAPRLGPCRICSDADSNGSAIGTREIAEYQVPSPHNICISLSVPRLASRDKYECLRALFSVGLDLSYHDLRIVERICARTCLPLRLEILRIRRSRAFLAGTQENNQPDSGGDPEYTVHHNRLNDWFLVHLSQRKPPAARPGAWRCSPKRRRGLMVRLDARRRCQMLAAR